MQQRALIEPRVPVLFVFRYLLLCHHSLTGVYSSVQTKEAQDEDGGVRKACMEAVCLSVATSSLLRVQRDNMYRTVVSLYPTTSVSTEAHRGSGVLLSR